MNRIDARLAELKQQGRKALVTYIVNGDPTPEATLVTMHAMVAAGADIIELGVPFSDPMAEGPVIALGHERALEHNTSLKGTMALVSEFRKQDSNTPVVLMGYANPIEKMGYEQSAKSAAEAGVDGFLTVDLPPEEAKQFDQHLNDQGLVNVFLIAPTTIHSRMESIAGLASGFLYYVSLKGVTGAGHLDVGEVKQKLAEMREVTSLPICVGFGIKDAESAKSVAANADGAVVGSLLVDAMGRHAGESAETIAQSVADLIAPIRAGLDELANS
jgi:tryptophan synthase alpha chain